MSRHQTSDDHDHGYIKSKERRCCNIQTYKCPICGNTDIHSIGHLNGKPYCRRCISFRGEEVEHKPSYPKKAPIHLEYELSPEQKELSDKLVENYKKGIDSLVFAVCGSGKTEITLKVISYAISKGFKVGFSIPRRDVVIELYERFKDIFQQNKIVAVYGGHTDELEGDLVCLTTHQLFRYEHYFDLLLLDEVDAFPYKGNDVLHSIFIRAVKKNYILLSATPSENFVKTFKYKGGDVLKLFARFHHQPLPVPEPIIKSKTILYYQLIKHLKLFLKEKKPVFVFTPTIEICEKTFNLIKLFAKNGNYVHSQHPNREDIIFSFKKGEYSFLVTTAVLERGVTIKNLQVIVMFADHSVYDSYSLVQIAGRVGRKKDATKGRVIYLAEEFTEHMRKSIEDIETANKSLQNMLQNL